MNPIKKVNTPKSSKNKNKNGLNYNQLFPQKTSDGSNYYMTRRTNKTMNNPNFTPFGNDYAIYTDPNLTYEYGNYRGFDINDDGNIYYNSDQDDYTNIKRAVNGQIPRSELGFARGGYIPTFANGGYANLPQYKFGSWLKNTLSNAGDSITEAPGKLKNWVSDAPQNAMNAPGKALNWAKNAPGNAVDWGGEKLDQVIDAPGKAINWAGNAPENLYNWGSEKYNQALDTPGKALNFGSEKINKLGNWSKDHVQGIAGAGMIVGGAAVTAGTLGLAAPIGVGMMTSGAGLVASDFQTNQSRNAAEDQMSAAASAEQKQALMLADQQSQNDMYNLTQSRLNEYNQQPQQQPQQQYSAFSAKNGGFMPSYSGGGFMDGVDKNNGVTYFAKGGTHEQNPHGGIPIGRKGRVEAGEFKAKLSKGEYIFSNRF